MSIHSKSAITHLSDTEGKPTVKNKINVNLEFQQSHKKALHDSAEHDKL